MEYGALDERIYKQEGDYNNLGQLTTVKETTLYVGKDYEHITDESGNVTHRYTISTGGGAVSIERADGTSFDEPSYLLTDHLGSTNVVLDKHGNVAQTLAFDPWGMRTNTGDVTSVNSLTNKGYTGHEMDDELGLINMNARIYDPYLGRFLSADTVLPDAYDMQAYNRYSYVLGNPLKYVDPTGHCAEPTSFVSVCSIAVASAINAFVGVLFGGGSEERRDEIRSGCAEGFGSGKLCFLVGAGSDYQDSDPKLDDRDDDGGDGDGDGDGESVDISFTIKIGEEEEEEEEEELLWWVDDANGPGFDSRDAAAKAFYDRNEILYATTGINQEIFGRIYQIGDRFYYSNAIVLTGTRVGLGFTYEVPEGRFIGTSTGMPIPAAIHVAELHTHPPLGSPYFSPTDTATLRGNQITGYLRTDFGALRSYTPGVDTDSRGTDACPSGTGPFCLNRHPLVNSQEFLEPPY